MPVRSSAARAACARRTELSASPTLMSRRAQLTNVTGSTSAAAPNSATPTRAAPPTSARIGSRCAGRAQVPRGRSTHRPGDADRDQRDYLERSFLPGRSFTGPDDFTAQLQQWLTLVNARRRRVLGCTPTERIAADRAAMLSLPPVAPATGWRALTRLARDHYVRIDSNDYSIHPAVIGRRIELVVGLHRIRALCGGRVVCRPRTGPGLAPDHR